MAKSSISTNLFSVQTSRNLATQTLGMTPAISATTILTINKSIGGIQRFNHLKKFFRKIKSQTPKIMNWLFLSSRVTSSKAKNKPISIPPKKPENSKINREFKVKIKRKF